MNFLEFNARFVLAQVALHTSLAANGHPVLCAEQGHCLHMHTSSRSEHCTRPSATKDVVTVHEVLAPLAIRSVCPEAFNLFIASSVNSAAHVTYAANDEKLN